MAKYSEEDFFAGTSMTFGEHLEELRSALFKSVVFLLAGFLVGLLLANHVVRFIQTPLERALERYQIARDIEILKGRYGPNSVTGMDKFIEKHRLGFSYIYVEHDELLRVAREAGGTLTFPQGNDRGNDLGLTHPVDGTSRNPEPTSVAVPSLEEVPDDPGDLAPPSPESRMALARIWTPLKARLTSLSAQEAFMIWLKAGFITGLILASPAIFFFIWNFVASGLYPHERNYVYIYLPFSLGLFLLGASMAFFLVFDPVLDFLLSFNRGMNIDPDPRISEWIGFVLFLPLGFGIAFQLPLVMLFINRLGIVSVESFLDKWRLAVLGIFFISMILTPADPVSMLMMAVPLTVLYFLGLLLCLWMPRGGPRLADA
jgi:sec-independent protein translocase protein TatC